MVIGRAARRVYMRAYANGSKAGLALGSWSTRELAVAALLRRAWDMQGNGAMRTMRVDMDADVVVGVITTMDGDTIELLNEDAHGQA